MRKRDDHWHEARSGAWRQGMDVVGVWMVVGQEDVNYNGVRVQGCGKSAPAVSRGAGSVNPGWVQGQGARLVFFRPRWKYRKRRLVTNVPDR
jgi:hypothetical protein